MGMLIYGGAEMTVSFDDRTLAHLQVVIGRKLGRRERFFFSWTDSGSVGSGRSAIWMDPSIPLSFVYRSSRSITINQDWLRELSDAANANDGLVYRPEPGDDDAKARLPRSHV